MVSVPATVRLDPPSTRWGRDRRVPSLTSAPVVDTEALFSSIERRPAPIEASPVRALFDPSAVLSSMKASFPLRRNCALAARLVICPLANSIALSPASQHCRSRLPPCRIPRCRSRRGAPGWRWSRADRSRPYYRAPPPSPCPTPRAWRCRCGDVPLLVSVPRHGQARSAVAADGVEIDGSVIGERAGRRHRGPVFELEMAPAPIEASPVSALFDPSAVLSSMKASFPLRRNCALAARLVICPLLNSIALSPASRT